jgi:outer membrane protein assembly factor BamE
MGTPVAASPFRDDRWDYTGYYKSPRGKVYSRTVTLFFDGNALARMEGVKLAEGQATDPAAIDAFDDKNKAPVERPIDKANPKKAPPEPKPPAQMQ